MADFVINERRREPRLAQATLRSGQPPQVPGARVIEVLDSSPRGLRCRLANPVRPGRAMSLRVADAGGAFALVTATVLRCEVCRLTRQGAQYEAAWALERPRPR